MQSLLYFLENQNIQDLRDKIISKIKDINNEDLLNKIYNNIKISDEDYNIYIEILNNRFKLIGLNNTTSNSIKQKIKHYGKLEEMSQIFGNDDLLITSNDLLNNTNIYDLIYDNISKNINIDTKFKSLIEDLADFDLPDKSIGKGKCEILSQLFLKDLNEGNKGKGDINCGNNILEYKLSTARIKSGTSKLESPKEINNKFIELLVNYINSISKKNINNIKEEFNFDIYEPNIFSSGTSIENYFNKLFEVFTELDSEKINEFIIESLLEEIPNAKEYKNEFIKIVKERPIVNNSGLYTTKSKKQNSRGKEIDVEYKNGINNFKHIFLLIHLYTYQFDEGWTDLILFGREKTVTNSKLTGNYCVIKSEKDIKKFNNQILDNNIFNNAFPMYTDGNKIKGSNERNWAPCILYVK